MANIVEFAPVFAEANNTEFHHVSGVWNSREQTERLAGERGHAYARPAAGGVDAETVTELLAGADVLVLAPTVAAPTGMWQPTDGVEAGRLIGHRLLDALSEEHPDLHVVLVSHFLVGHGVAHKNAKPNTWGLRALEGHLRAGRNPWTILRPTWLSQLHDASYQIRLTQDQHADGLVTRESVAAAVIAAVENPDAASGRTAAIYNLNIPENGTTDLVSQFEALEPDFEAQLAQREAHLVHQVVGA